MDQSECFSPSDSSINPVHRCETTMSYQAGRVDAKNNSFWSTLLGNSKHELFLNSLNPCVELYTTIQGKIKIKSTRKDLFGYISLYYDKSLHQGVPKLLRSKGLDWLLQARFLIEQTRESNYEIAKVIVPTVLNIPVWRKHLILYKDNRVIDYLEFGFPLCVKQFQPTRIVKTIHLRLNLGNTLMLTLKRN